MLPGVDASAGLPAFSKGDLLAVCVRGNPVRGATNVECAPNFGHALTTYNIFEAFCEVCCIPGGGTQPN